MYVVHIIDTEGPLFEPIDATFERIKGLYGYDLPCSPEVLSQLRRGEIVLDGKEKEIQELLQERRIQTHPSWTEISNMLDEITSKEYREIQLDSFGGHWIYNWFCLDHVGFTGINPRRRDIGFHKVFDFYRKYLQKLTDSKDQIQWHYHALSITNDAHRAGSTFLNSGHIYEILSRRIIDRNWFPIAFRAGHNTERPDLNFFLEQWIPYDFSCLSPGNNKTNVRKETARYNDWRRAPKTWIPYHPDYNDYQRVGNCRRLIARCLPIDEREYSITVEDVDQAFREADSTGSAILAFMHHDFREMNSDIETIRDLIRECSDNTPHVSFKYCSAVDAMKYHFYGKTISDELGLEIELKSLQNQTQLLVTCSEDIFGPQPFLALKTKGGEYHWQNFDFEDDNKWSYSFDANNIMISEIQNIGVAANSVFGLTEVITQDIATGTKKKTILNQ